MEYFSRHIQFFALCSIVILCSCKKEKEKNSTITISAIAVDNTTKQPVSGLKIYLVTGGYRLVFFSEPWSILSADTTTTSKRVINYLTKDSTITDSRGRFSFQFTPVEVPLEGFPPPHLRLEDAERLRAFVRRGEGVDDTNIDTLFTDRKSYLKINVQKSTAAFPNDTVFQNLIYLKSPSDPLKNAPYLKGQVGLTSCVIKDSFSYSTSNKILLEWRYYRNGLQSSNKDTVNLIPYSTTIVNINY